ncbi:MAG: UDP-N-acetylglucosamine--N-acetylmuramyl-(pentapeptide) pyrophosphoryl-undecaprenol N-acetylglucosamine transferase [Anaerolineales bacterium]
MSDQSGSSLKSKIIPLWVGGIGGMEKELVRRAGFPYEEIPAAGLHGVGWKRIPGNLYQLGQGILAARTILSRFQPDVIFFTGGFLAFPVAVAARTMRWKQGRPRHLLYVPDIEPALALKVIARFADHIAVTTETTRQYYPKKKDIIVSGYPTRLEHQKWVSNSNRKEEACQLFGLDSQNPIILVFGGSKGARSINNAVLANLMELLNVAQIVHITGNLDWEVVQKKIHTLKEHDPSGLLNRYHAYPYLHEEMSAALAAADLTICRAGASVLGELPLFGLPAILVPYPHAWRYQQVNAEYLAQHQAALIMDDHHLTDQLLPRVSELIFHTEKLEAMRQAMKRLAKPDAAHTIAQCILELGTHRGGVND